MLIWFQQTILLRLCQGPPTCLQITVCEKKFMGEVELGGADVNLESLGSGGQIEEWVPLRAGKDGITWYDFEQ